jgi:hypothetical protein
MLRIWIAMAVVAGCGRHINPDYCATHDDPECPNADAAQDCDHSCAPLVCDHSSNTCVDCTPESNVCPASAPMCGSDDHCHSTCDSCASHVCKPDGSCEDINNVIYVSPTGAGNTCTPNAKCTLREGLTHIGGVRLAVKLDPGQYLPPDGAGLQINTVNGRLIGFGAALNGGGPVLDVVTNADVEIDGLEISGGMGGGGAFGLRCAAGANVKLFHVLFTSNLDPNGSAVSSACALTINASTFTANERALVITGGVIDVRNNLFVKNGKADLQVPPIAITGDTTGGFRFNTTANNTTKMDKGPAGILCDPVDPTNLNTDGNIITDNDQQGQYLQQFAGGCAWSTSYTTPGAGTNQLLWDTLSYHLTGNSPGDVRDVAGVSCNGMTDIDDQARPINGGLGPYCDYGADEYKP